MEIDSEAESELKSNLRKCRCCLRMLIDTKKAISITAQIQTQFLQLTNIFLLPSEFFSDRICQLCSGDLETFSNLRNDLIAKQKNLYELAGLDDISFTIGTQYEEVVIAQLNDDQETEMGIEVYSPIRDDDELTECANEDVPDEEESAETSEAAETIIRIERINDDSATEQLKIEEDTMSEFTEYYIENSSDTETTLKTEKDEDQTFDSTKTACEHCGILVSSKNLYQHVSALHKPFSCNICEKTFSSKPSLKRHLTEQHQDDSDNKHAKLKRHFCDCGKEYDYKKQLDDHIRSFHDKERDEQCKMCKKFFYHRDLKKHILHVHGEKSIECPSCKKLFSCNENLKLHMKYHNDPEYQCTFCNKWFHQKILYDHHVVKHSNIKDHICSSCDAAFYTPRDLKRHVQRVHDRVSRKCFSCEMIFTRKDKYREHILKQHKELGKIDLEIMLNEIKIMKWNES